MCNLLLQVVTFESAGNGIDPKDVLFFPLVTSVPKQLLL